MSDRIFKDNLDVDCQIEVFNFKQELAVFDEDSLVDEVRHLSDLCRLPKKVMCILQKSEEGEQINSEDVKQLQAIYILFYTKLGVED